MKKILSALIASAIVFSLAACGGNNNVTSQSGSQAGTPAADAQSYTAMAQGYAGEFPVTVEIAGDRIVSVTVGEHNETPGLGTIPLEQLPPDIVEYQTIALDAITGATITGDALLAAVADCIQQAGLDLAAFQVAAARDLVQEDDVTLEADIAIIGAGGAGLAAAIEAAEAGKSVIILEKMPMAGGNTIKATGGMNASETIIQEMQGGSYSNEDFYNFTFEGGHRKADPELLRFYVDNSASAVEWLYNMGTNFTWNEGAAVGMLHSVNNGGAVGPELMRVLGDKCRVLGVEILLNTKATELIQDSSGAVVGVIAEGRTGNTVTVNAKAVIMAAGGFGADEAMFTSYRPELKGFVTTNHSGATGDGIFMGEAIGAAVVDMGEIQIHPTVEQDTASMITESLRTDGGILLNTSGLRFTNENGTRDVVSAAVIAQDSSMAYLVIDDGIREVRTVANTYIDQGFMKKYDTLAELAADIGVDADVVEKTIADWNAAVAAKRDSEFDSTFSFDRDLSTAPYYAVRIAPGVHHTMGGLKINTNTEVIGTDGNVIPGFFAAGEVVGGIHGGNRIGGNAITDIVVFGRTAGVSAAAYVD